jgi:hypothetical protein
VKVKNEVPRVQNKQSKKKNVVTSAEDCLSEGSILKKTKKESRAIDYKREKLNEKLQQTSNAPFEESNIATSIKRFDKKSKAANLTIKGKNDGKASSCQV